MNFNQYKWYVCILTFITYAAMYSTRSAYSYNKQSYMNDMDLSPNFIGSMDMFFLLALASSYLMFGDIAKQIGIKYYLCIGIIFSTFCYLSNPFMRFYGLEEPEIIFIVMTLNGIFQACVWPSLVAIMGNWFGKGKRGLLMGIWSCNANFGNIVGMQICHSVIFNSSSTWETCFLITGLIFLFFGIFNLLFLKTSPQEAGFKPLPMDYQKNNENSENSDSFSNGTQQKQNGVDKKIFELNIFTAWTVPGVLPYTISYACLKSTQYGLLFWLPLYLDSINLSFYSAKINQIMQLGALAGGIIGGSLSDKLGKRAIVMCPMIFLAALFMYAFKIQDQSSIYIYYFLIFGIGVCQVGPYNLIGSAISIDLAEQPLLKDSKNTIARISSLIEGSAAITAASAQKLIPMLGTKNLFYLFIALCVMSGMLLVPMLIKDIKELQKKIKKNNKYQKVKEIIIKDDNQQYQQIKLSNALINQN